MVSRPFGSMTALICLGILPIKFLQNSSGILRIQTNLIALFRAIIFRGFSETLFLKTVQKFSIDSRLRLFLDRNFAVMSLRVQF